MRKGAVLLLLVLLLSAVRVAGARTEPGTPLVEPPGPAYAIADEQFISGTLRDQLAVARFLEAEGSILAGNELEPVSGRPMPAAAALAFLGEAYTVSPSLLLALIEMEHGMLSERELPKAFSDRLRWQARMLSRWFYDYYYRQGAARDGGPGELNAGNAGTYALRNYFFAQVYGRGAYPAGEGERDVQLAAWERTLAATYGRYFGSLWAGRLAARRPAAADYNALPSLELPWNGDGIWYFTGGPHNFDGSNRLPLSGVDFQPVGYGGCNPPVAREQWVVAAAGGRTVGYQSWWLKLDHDFDGDVMSGWQTVYGHLAHGVAPGLYITPGQRLGNPSCYGGFASGVHVHFGVKFENVWQPVMDISLSGWHFERGEEAYEGWMVRPGGAERRACFDPETRKYDCTHGTLLSRSDDEVRQSEARGVFHQR